MKNTFLGRRFKPVRLKTVTPRERLVLSVILGAAGALTRSELIRKTQLPGAAIFRITEDLARRGLLDLGEGVINGPGKPSTRVRLRADALATVGLSIMTDLAEAVLLDFMGNIRAVRDLSVPGMALEPVFDNLQRFIEEESARAGFAPDTVFGLGLAFAGYFTGEGSQMNPAGPLDDWALRDLRSIATAKTGLEVEVENIANATAVGEQILGVGRWAENFAYVNVSHGLGVGLITNGSLYRGRYGNAGEVASLVKFWGQLPIPNLETLRAALAREGIETSSITDMVTRYEDDWPGIANWVAWAAPSFSFLASVFRYTLDCDAVVFGGRPPRSLSERIAASVRWPDEGAPQRRNIRPPVPKLVAAEISSQAAAVGAAAIPFRRGYFQ
jgi:predicted NBD/HSP70 family sugar kinase